MTIQHQISNRTAYDRYPNIFSLCKKIKEDSRKILSFGCSTGEEAFTLKNKYFKKSIIHGLDIDPKNIQYCNQKNNNKDILFFDYNNFDISERYDIIFCMSVLCRWTDTKLVNDCSNIYSFSTYENEIQKIHYLLNNKGLLVIYNSNFAFSDANLYSEYTAIIDESIKESGFVKKFDKNNKETNRLYSECIFMKK